MANKGGGNKGGGGGGGNKGGGGGGGGNKGGGGGGGFLAQFNPPPAPRPAPAPSPSPFIPQQQAPRPAPQPAPRPAPSPFIPQQSAPRPAPQPAPRPAAQPAPAPRPAAQSPVTVFSTANQQQRQTSANPGKNKGKDKDRDNKKENKQQGNIFTQIAQKTSGGTGTSSSGGNKKQNNGGGSGNNGGGGKAADLKNKLKDIIKSSEGGAIANPERFKKLLNKLKDTSNKKAVEKIRDLKKETLSSQRTPVTPGPTTPSSPSTPTTPNRPTRPAFPTFSGAGAGSTAAGGGPTGEEAGQAGGGFDFEQQAEDLLAGFDEKFETDFGRGEEAFQEDRSTAAGNFEADIQKFLDEFRSDQAGRQSALEDTLTDLAAQGAEFDPERFRTTLLELESSRRRQKDWNERSARQAYKY